MNRKFIPLKIALLKISDTRTLETDTVTPVLEQLIQEEGHIVFDKQICTDSIYQIRNKISKWISEESIQVVLTTGGTGVTGRDGTPEAIRPLLDKEIEGFGEVFRIKSMEFIGMSTIQSRCLAGVANGIYIFCFPGSKGACKDGWNLVRGQLDFRTKPCNLVELMPRLKEKETPLKPLK